MDYRCASLVPHNPVYKPPIAFYTVLHETSRRNCLWWMTPLILSTAMAFTSFDKWRNCFVIGIPSKKRKANKSCPVVALGTYHVNILVSRKFWVVVNLLIPSDQFRNGTLKYPQPVFLRYFLLHHTSTPNCTYLRLALHQYLARRLESIYVWRGHLGL
jgi:hypothetical protein